MNLFGEFEKCGRPRPRGADLLVVDQSRTNLQVMGGRLTRLGYGVALIDNGAEALDLIQARRFDLLLLDLAMTDAFSGLMVLRELRGGTTTAEMPVVVVSSRSDPAAAVEALQAGADDHIAKPFDFDVLAARIDRRIKRHRMVEILRRSYADLDARIARRAVELGELRAEMAQVQADRARLMSTVDDLNGQLERLGAGH